MPADNHVDTYVEYTVHLHIARDEFMEQRDLESSELSLNGADTWFIILRGV